MNMLESEWQGIGKEGINPMRTMFTGSSDH
jgi:hypothetical protein